MITDFYQSDTHLSKLASGLKPVQGVVDFIKPEPTINNRTEETSLAGGQQVPKLGKIAVSRSENLKLPDE